MLNSSKLICGLARKCTVPPSSNIKFSSFYSTYRKLPEPDYLDSKEPEVPIYDLLNIKMQSYDFYVLENFSGYVHKTAENMGIEVTECWAVPCQKHEIHSYKSTSMQIESRYSLNTYERNVQVAELPSTKAPIFFSVIQTALPEGVRLDINHHSPDDELVRYVPDLELNQLKSALVDLGGPSKFAAKQKK
uniref:EOG090X0MUO n=1 Tax=Evadne anonyx TaxID=141404 RepID=A0A9N6WTP6_9CRUS|nr:EOG090X0MUO [Evadne anonyx]